MNKVSKFKKKPIEIDAIQLKWENWNRICDFVDVGTLEDGKPQGCYIDELGQPTSDITDIIGLYIPTLEGLMVARQDDWIIKGVNGEFYPCKPDIFEKTYEPC